MELKTKGYLASVYLCLHITPAIPFYSVPLFCLVYLYGGVRIPFLVIIAISSAYE